MDIAVPTRRPADRRGHSQSERALRVAAATLRQATSADVGATRVVCAVPASGRLTFEALVSEIATEFRLKPEIRYRQGTCSVRFARP